jgi:creatinine amidohydrolase/Fe(II)-dependent formamide hydrolase-like protein
VCAVAAISSSAWGNLLPPVRKPGEPRDPNVKRVNNGISGDARRSTADIGKRVSDMKVEYAVRQIRELLKDSAPVVSTQ